MAHIDPNTVLTRYLQANALFIPPALERDLEIVSKVLKGSKLQKLQESIQLLRDCIAHGAWLPRAQVKVMSGISKGLVNKMPSEHVWDHTVGKGYSETTQAESSELHEMAMCLQYGTRYLGDKTLNIPGLDPVVQKAWFELVAGIHKLCQMLNSARPKPVKTEVGLSPKVTKTLKEMNLDIDMSTIDMPPTKQVGEKPRLDKKTGRPIYEYGKPAMDPIYRIIWPPGTKKDVSRFSADHGQCEACGKAIPSYMFVPLSATCRNLGPVGFWVGVDCARNIFGVKDEGFDMRDMKDR